jgi:hypothetical protein
MCFVGWVEMERATNPDNNETAERLLKRYADSLPFESISIFKEDGTLLYSSDPTLQQQDGTESLFDTLDGFYYAFEIEEICSITVYDNSNCLFIVPLYLGNWGEVEGWLFALGSCEEIGCAGIADQFIIQLEKLKKKDISEELTIERHKKKLRNAFDLPKILGREFDRLENCTVMLDGIKGFVLQTYGDTPWGIVTKKSGREYPEPFSQLYHNLVLEIDELAIGVPTSDQDTMESDRELESMLITKYPESNRLLSILLLYSLFMGVVLRIVDTNSLVNDTTLVIGLDLFLLVGVFLERNSSRSNPCCSCMIFLIGIIVMISGIAAIFVSFNVMSVSYLLIGIYGIIAGVLFYVTRKERMKAKYPMLHN